MLRIVGIRGVRESGQCRGNEQSKYVLCPELAAHLLSLIRHTLSCVGVNGASGAQIFKTSTKQQAVNARTPLSLWPRRFCPASSFATFVNESLSVCSWSISRSSLARVSRRPSRSPVGMGLPARHDRGSLKTNPPSCGSSATTSAPRRGAILK